ncbi:MAG: beta-lactamase family protein [Lentisphaeria bacterium]|nr:beta-lactamase family protein [Lentisphaeria bacterium]
MKLKSLFLLPVLALALLSGCISDGGTHFAADAVGPYIKSGECPGAISILYQDGKQEVALLGYADADKEIPIRLDQMFMQCSQTKGFCGVTIAILVEEGKISLDDPVAKYLPEFKNLKVAVKGKNGKTMLVPAKNTLTIRMVMNHTGGFPFEIPTKVKSGWPALPLRETAREAASQPLRFEPGTKALYSNTGIDIGAAVVEVVTGKSWDAFLKERVLDPLGMTSSTFNPTDGQLKNIIQMYTVKPGKKAKFQAYSKWMPLPHNGPKVYPSAGAGLWTNAADQYKFYKMLMNLGVGDNGARILKEETVKSLLATSSRPEKLGKYSLGLSVDNEGEFGHGGAWGTSAKVNWKKKQLAMWIVQQVGTSRGKCPWFKAWNKKAAAKFFAEKSGKSSVDAYTGRLD